MDWRKHPLVSRASTRSSSAACQRDEQALYTLFDETADEMVTLNGVYTAGSEVLMGTLRWETDAGPSPSSCDQQGREDS